MPKAEIPQQSAKAVLEGTFGPTTWVNVMYFDVAASPGSELQIADDIGDACAALWSHLDLGHFSVNWTHHLTKVLYRPLDPSVPVKSTRIADVVGTAAGGDQDAQVAYLVNWSTGDTRRGGKPRNYFPGVPLSACADSAAIQSSVISSFASGLSDWLTSLGDGTLPNGTICSLCEMSFVDGKADRAVPAIFDITSGNLSAFVATQRRRIDRLR